MIGEATAANYKWPWASLAGCLQIPAQVTHQNTFWELLMNVTNVADHEPGLDSSAAVWMETPPIGCLNSRAYKWASALPLFQKMCDYCGTIGAGHECKSCGAPLGGKQ